MTLRTLLLLLGLGAASLGLFFLGSDIGAGELELGGAPGLGGAGGREGEALDLVPTPAPRVGVAVGSEPEAESKSPQAKTPSSNELVLDSQLLTNPAVTTLAEFYGVSPNEAVLQLQEVWPDLLTFDAPEPLPWAEVEPKLMGRLERSIFGNASEAEAYFQMNVLGETAQVFVDSKAIGEDLNPELLAVVTEEVQSILTHCVVDYEFYHNEYVAALASKVAAGNYDYGPYILFAD